MDLLNNPFQILGATPQDDRHRILAQVRELSLMSDEREIASASCVLTHPRKRLSAEIAWLPGLSANNASEMISLIQAQPDKILRQDRLPHLARTNLLATGMKRVAEAANISSISNWIKELSVVFDKIDYKVVLRQINDGREVSGFPAVKNQDDLVTEIENRRQFYRSTIRDSVKHLSKVDLVKMVTKILDTTTAMGSKHAPLLIYDLVDIYKVEVQELLDSKEEEIDGTIQLIQNYAEDSDENDNLCSSVDELVISVRSWDSIAQPIQVSTMSNGWSHDRSIQMAHKVRAVALHLCNMHNELALAKKIATMLQAVFKEVVDVAELANNDVSQLEENTEMHKLSKVNDFVEYTIRRLKTYPEEASENARMLIELVSDVVPILDKRKIPHDFIVEYLDKIALLLLSCAVATVNATGENNDGIVILGSAEKYATKKHTLELIQGAQKALHSEPSTLVSFVKVVFALAFFCWIFWR